MNITEQKNNNLSIEEILNGKLDDLLNILKKSQTTTYNSTTLLIELTKFLEKWHKTCEDINVQHQQINQEIFIAKEKLTSMEVKISRLDDKLEAMLKIIANQSEQLSEINQNFKNSQIELSQNKHQNGNSTSLSLEEVKFFI
ncbi:MAG: DUF1664 domain-containing protein [Nostoc sp.]|uniref:DUF1664 domain-containing protein n=1 Tax=Nostoc favosum CHAB5714 TaxID=2780399 RepID=A0ABS8IKS9_9NOSO|nr:DUF1664 domain-containing protein [Nostoc favosum]MCC5604424.1 DUF1664 domain-containing protein [Nostoc favosum CHAB5714]